MTFLYIDTVSPRNRYLVLTEEKKLFSVSFRPHQNEAEQLLFFLRKQRRILSKLSAIFVITGPGKFTSSRVGITVANTLSYVLHIPLYGIDRFELLLYQRMRRTPLVFPFHIYIESQQGDYFYARYTSLHKRTIPHLVQDITTKEKQNVCCIQKDGRMLHNGKKVSTLPLSYIFLQLVVQYGKSSALPVIPLYIREANITKRKKR